MSRFARGRGLALRLAAGLTGLALVVGASACGTSNPAGDSRGGEVGTAAGWPRTIVHDKGSTEIKAKPQRIVALDNSLVEAVVLLGRPLVGGIASYRNLKTFPDYLGDAVKDTKDIGPLDNPNLELIASLRPDLIVSATIRHDALYDKLSAIAPTVFVKTTGPIWKDNITLLGKALGEETRAAQELARYEARAKQIGDEINAKANNPTISVVRFVDGPTRLMARASFIGIILADAGLRRPPSQDKDEFATEISEEQIELADADHIFVTTYSGGEEYKQRFEANPLWKRLSAVQAGRLHEVKDELWMTSVSVQGAHFVLDDLASTFQVDPAK
ncbi:ABC transporter substrate-binding protein [Micromonospora sp. HM5-17]|jgi:iron complex transport system substrate-binding protein|uniref:ABC transporter substrate-binding protein n=1 Tax=Micromonospora sp. HM5-17 TaxID=2487710 RepID=UPI000F475082|nr:iron-siderophore ABC transporter substrate-binding protein [Micromonospora sp. HM5-17]ROT32319.1 iron-siderophore ABC transporter substrate-binding protein [Micromonospora sp. HM5-17]